MNASTATAVAAGTSALAPLLDPKVSNIMITTFTLVAMMLTVPGMVFNAINMIVFCTIGSFDSVTICFLFLALVDFFGMIDLAVLCFMQFCSARELTFSWTKNLDTYSFAFATTFTLLADMNSATVTFIAVQRGLAVALPFMARYLFNRKKSFIFIVTVLIVMTLLWLPRSTIFQFVPKPDPNDNTTTILAIVRADNYGFMFKVYVTVSKVFIGISEYITMNVCAVFIYKGMRSSLQLKTAKSSSVFTTTASTGIAKEKGGAAKKTDPKTDADDQQEANNDKKNNKERLVIKQSFLLVVCQILCTGPSLVAAVLNHYHPRLKSGKDQQLNFTIFTGCYIFYGANAVANFFIYLTFNTKFRTTLKSFFVRN